MTQTKNVRTVSSLALAATAVALLTGAAPAPASDDWAAPTDVEAGVRAAGLEMLDSEKLTMHIHPHLTVYADGDRVTVPADLGIDRSGEKPRYSPLHTHDTSGTVHVESATWQDFTLGQLFAEWGVRPQCLAEVDGLPVAGDPARIVFRDRQEITLRCR
ncbi:MULTISPECIES: hypothetical protein [unclassified Streptomyces]|uniref:hypothetical protein n=1 Tax=unclassified Streptomyces TaxID=2593676 RepID=UPI00278C0D02|nr:MULTISPECIES: hypothetical protein [unclassified Streptomyces]